MKRTPAIIAIVIIIVAAALVLVLRKDDNKNDSNANTSDTSQTSQETTDSAAGTSLEGTDAANDTPDATASEGVTITYGNDGFSPSSVTIKAGQTLTVKNTSSKTVDYSSDPHPSHTNNPELNIGDIAPGKSGTAVVKNTGTWGYHNHLNSSETGTIVIN